MTRSLGCGESSRGSDRDLVRITSWSPSLQSATRDAIASGGVLSPDGRLHLKRDDGSFGFVEEPDLWRGVIRVVDKANGAETIFADAEALIAAGWVVD